MPSPPRVTLYERDGCHLCEEARQLLDAMLGPDRYARVDIETANDLIVRYGFRIPVVALNDEDRLEAPITGPDLRALLAEISPRAPRRGCLACPPGERCR